MWTTAERTIEALVILLAVVLLAGQAVGHPVLLGYVTTGSMEPTLEPGDGFVSLPPAIAGDPDPGDVIVYRAEQVNGGELTTHRVVRDTDRGYVTRGDANPFTDQSAGEPPVRDPQVVAVGVRPGGTLLTIPELGTIVTALGGIASGAQGRIPSHIWIGAGVAAAFVLLATGGTGDGRRTPVEDRSAGHTRGDGLGVGPRGIILLFGLVVVTTATASALAPLGPTEYRVVSADADLPGPRVIPAGQSETTTYQVPGGSIVPVKYYLEPASDGVQVVDGETGRVGPNSAVNATIRLFAPPENGVYRRYVAENRYPLVLPERAVDALYSVHVFAPVVALDALLAIPFVLAARLVGGRHRPRGSPGAATGLTGLGWLRR